MKCRFRRFEPATGDRERYRCDRCGLTTNPTKHPPEKVHATCRYSAVGDWLEHGLRACGVTTDRYTLVRDWLYRLCGLAPPRSCGCGKRRDWLNELTWPLVHAVWRVRLRMRALVRWLAGMRKPPRLRYSARPRDVVE